MPIDRRRFLVLSSGAVALSPFARVLAEQAAGASQQAAGTAPQAPAAPPPTVTAFIDVRRNVAIFTGRGGTIGYLINKDAVLAIDTQYPDTAKICLEGLKQKAGRGIDVLFNTHHHADHTGGNGVFKAETKKIVAHAKVPELQKMVAATAPATAAPPVFPDATFDKTWTEKAGDETVTATYNGPGHTSGDSIIHFERAHV